MSSARRRVSLVAEGPTGLSALRGLLPLFDVVVVVRRGDEGDDVIRLARKSGVPVVDCESVTDLEQVLERYDPEIVAVSSYSRIIPRRLLERWDFINVHYSPLPAYRGRANVNWAIINGEDIAAITVHRIAPGLDAGPILIQRQVSIGARSTITEIYATLNGIQEEILGHAIQLRLDGADGQPQDESRATYGCTRVAEDGLIDWRAPTITIDRLVRALARPFPEAFTYLDLRRVGILNAEPVDDPPVYVGRVPGRVVRIDRDEGSVDVLTGDGVLRLLRIEVDGRAMRPADLVRSVRATFGVSVTELVEVLRSLRDEASQGLVLSSRRGAGSAGLDANDGASPETPGQEGPK